MNGYDHLQIIKDEPFKIKKYVRFNIPNTKKQIAKLKRESKKDKYIYIENHRFIIVE
jgi:hypothetical protein